MMGWCLRLSLQGMAVGLLLAPFVASAQECPYRLSEFEQATRTLADKVQDIGSELARGFATFEALNDQAKAAPDSCPAGLDQSRETVSRLDIGTLVSDGYVGLDCGLFFSQRVLSDIDAARAANDSQLLLRLGELQQRIFGVQRLATESAKEATFLLLRAGRLVDEHLALGNRCSMLSDIYE